MRIAADSFELTGPAARVTLFTLEGVINAYSMCGKVNNTGIYAWLTLIYETHV